MFKHHTFQHFQFLFLFFLHMKEEILQWYQSHHGFAEAVTIRSDVLDPHSRNFSAARAAQARFHAVHGKGSHFLVPHFTPNAAAFEDMDGGNLQPYFCCSQSTPKEIRLIHKKFFFFCRRRKYRTLKRKY